MAASAARTLVRVLPFLHWVRLLKAHTVRHDSIAAFIGATVVLPQGIAYAAIAGLPPQYGLYTAIVTPVIAALFGSSWHLVSGPTLAISAVVFSTLAIQFEPGTPAYIEAALILTLLAGLFQLGLGLARLGQLVTFVSHSVMVGFTAGAAALIGLSQLKDVIGQPLPRPEHALAFARGLWELVPEANPYALALAAVTLASAVLCKRLAPAWPNYLVALIAGTLAGVVLDVGRHGVPLVEPVASGIPALHVPAISLEAVRGLSQGALAVALIGLLEAISIARAMATKSRQVLDSNQEIIGQGLSNVIGPFFSAYVGSGSFTRSGLNFEAGARTPLAAILAGVFLLVILMVVAPLVGLIPIPVMAGLILLVAWRLIDIKEIVHIVRSSGSETLIAAVTFLSVIFVGLEFAIYSGVILSLCVFLRQTMRPGLPIGAPDPSTPQRSFANAELYHLPECPQIVFTRFQGALYFGAVESLQREFRRIEETRAGQKHLVIRIDGSSSIDLAAAHLLIDEAKRRAARGGGLYLSVRYPPLRRQLAQFNLTREIGRGHVFRRKDEAIHALVPHRLDPDICARCAARIFRECPPPPTSDEAGSH